VLCTTQLTMAGTWTIGNPVPTGYPGGCWPDGDWKFTVTLGTSDCATAPAIEQSYDFKVTEDMDYNDTVTYTNDPNNMYVTAHISTDGGGVCGGQFLIYSADGKTVYNLHPVTHADNTIDGMGDIKVYDTDQRL
jgi:hypothetical protein